MIICRGLERRECKGRGIVGVIGEVVDWRSGMPFGRLGRRGWCNAVRDVYRKLGSIWFPNENAGAFMGHVAETREGDIDARIEKFGAVYEVICHHSERKVDC